MMLANIFKWEVFVFDTDLKMKTKHLSVFFLQKRWIKQIVAHHYAFGTAHTQAIEAAEKIVDNMTGHSVIKAMVDLYGDDEVLLVFKRILAEELAVLTSMQTYFSMMSLPSNASIFLLPGKHCALMGLLNKFDVPTSFPMNVRIVGKGAGTQVVSFFPCVARWLFVIVGYSVHLLAQWFRGPVVAKHEIKFGISLSAPWFEKFKGGPREFTFLIDDSDMLKSEAGFLVEYQNTESFYEEYRAKGYQLFSSTRPRTIYRLFAPSILKSGCELRYLPTLLSSSFGQSFIRKSVVNLLAVRIHWGQVLSNVHFKHYVYCNKEGVNQIAANIFFRRLGIVSWNYSQFVGGPYQIDASCSPFDSRNVLWSFLNSDNFMLNCDAMTRSMKKQHQSVRSYKVIGNIFSEMIAGLDRNTVRTQIGMHENEKDLKTFQNRRAVAVFDTSYVDIVTMYSNYEEAANFLDDIIKLARAREDLFFLFKPSKDDDYFINPRMAWSSPDKGHKIVALRKQLSSLPNTRMFEDSFDPIEVIAACNAVITHCFSSPTADALSTGLPAFWYESGEATRGYPLDQVKGLVAHGYHDLLAQLEIAFIDGYVNDLYDQENFCDLVNKYRDNSALTRLRRDLCVELSAPQI